MLANDPLDVPTAPGEDRMSSSDGEDGQCNRTIESNVAMGDVLAKKHTDDAPRDGCGDAGGDLAQRDSIRICEYEDDAVRSPDIADSVSIGVRFPLSPGMRPSCLDQLFCKYSKYNNSFNE